MVAPGYGSNMDVQLGPWVSLLDQLDGRCDSPAIVLAALSCVHRSVRS